MNIEARKKAARDRKRKSRSKQTESKRKAIAFKRKLRRKNRTDFQKKKIREAARRCKVYMSVFEIC